MTERSLKRKASKELSTNPNTVKARKRMIDISLDPVRVQIEKAKSADQAAITYAKKKLRKQNAYMSATSDVKEQMLNACAEQVINRR